MPVIAFIERSGIRRNVIAYPGGSAMRAAARCCIQGFIGECGGACVCATCHCYIDSQYSYLVFAAGND